MKKIFLGVILFSLACNQPYKRQVKAEDALASAPVDQPSANTIPARNFSADSMRLVGDTIWGNFDGRDTGEKAFVKLVKAGIGNPVDGGIPSEFEIKFDRPSLPPIKIGCCEVILINEGDLLGESKDAISVYQAPENGTINRMTTYVYGQKTFDTAVGTFLIRDGDSTISREYLDGLVFRKSDSICHLDMDSGIVCSKH